MSYCSNCGSELKERVQFCPNCGTKIEEQPLVFSEHEACPASIYYDHYSQSQHYPPIRKSKKSNTKLIALLIIIILVVAVAIISALFLFNISQDDKSKFIGTWKIVENNRCPEMIGSTLTFHEGGTLSSPEAPYAARWKFNDGKLYIKDASSEWMINTYRFTNNDKRLEMSDDTGYVVVYEKMN